MEDIRLDIREHSPGIVKGRKLGGGWIVVRV